jgi:cytochrome P450 / NADPH-cytochrome P450 reductase
LLLAQVPKGFVAVLGAASALLTSQRREAPGPTPRLFIGNLLDLLPSAVPACRRLYKQYGGIVKLHLFGKSVFVITDPDYLQPVLDLPNKRLPAQELAGNGLFLSDGPTWKLARGTLSPYFTVKYINEFVPLFADRARHLIQEAEKLPVTQPIDVMDAMTKLAFESICSAGFTYDVNMLDKGLLSDEEPPFISAFQYAFEKQKTRMFRLQFFNKFPTISNIKFWNSLERLNKSVDEIIDTHCPMTGASGPNPHVKPKAASEKKDLLSLMLDAQNPETGEKLSRENIREQCITLLVAGHKTTTLLSGWFVYCLSQHPEVEQKLVEELFSIFGTGASFTFTL